MATIDDRIAAADECLGIAMQALRHGDPVKAQAAAVVAEALIHREVFALEARVWEDAGERAADYQRWATGGGVPVVRWEGEKLVVDFPESAG